MLLSFRSFRKAGLCGKTSESFCALCSELSDLKDSVPIRGPFGGQRPRSRRPCCTGASANDRASDDFFVKACKF